MMEEGSSLTASATILLRLLKYISLVVCVVVVDDDVVTADDADVKRM